MSQPHATITTRCCVRCGLAPVRTIPAYWNGDELCPSCAQLLAVTFSADDSWPDPPAIPPESPGDD